LEGDCHYLEGNITAKRRVEYIAGLLNQIGLEGERVQMYNLSSAMGARFAEVAAEMTEKMKEIGPNPLKKEERVNE
jgi:coenzyme F420-reducing hydrogenase delta subunit